jgi:hypothetical protein
MTVLKITNRNPFDKDSLVAVHGKDAAKVWGTRFKSNYVLASHRRQTNQIRLCGTADRESNRHHAQLVNNMSSPRFSDNKYWFVTFISP